MADTVELDMRVPAKLHGARLDQAAAQLFPQYSRSRLQAWIKKGELCVDGQPARPRDKVRADARLQVLATLEDEVTWRAEPSALDIVFEDAEILVVNKPAGLVVHPAAGHADGTLVNALLAHSEALSRLPRAGIVHRLDKDTSGVMVVAKTLEAHADLVAQLHARSVRREYCAVCIGTLTGGGTVDAPMGRHPRQRKKMAVVEHGGKPAVTHYRIEARFGHHTQLRVNLETGRTHQIRVHMAHRHHPLIGDPVYGGRPRLPKGASATLIDALRSFGRQALHARTLGLNHPVSGEALAFESPLPADITGLLDVLQREDPVEAGDADLY